MQMFTHNVTAAIGEATNTQLRQAYRYLSLIDAAYNLPGASAVLSCV